LRTIRLIAVLGVTIVVAAGCGSSSKKLSYSAFIDKANTICRTGSAEVKGAKSSAAAGTILDKYVPQLKALKPPDVLQPYLDTFISTTEQEVEALKKNDEKTFNAVNVKNNEAASKMGTKECIG
jgi:hypothetical protein